MIGREDVVIDRRGSGAADALDAVARIVLRRWEHAVFQDAQLGVRFSGFSTIPFGRVRELLIYRDEDAFRSWEEHGADPENADTMIHALTWNGELTLVVDDRTEGVAHSVITEVESLLRAGLPGSVHAAFKPAA